MKEISVLVVEDESIVAMELEGYIQKLHYSTAGVASSAEEALALLAEQEVHIILMDIHINGCKDGIETAFEVRKSYPDIAFIFLTAHTDEHNVDRAIQLNPVAYLTKPFKRDELRIFLKMATKKTEEAFQSALQDPNHIVLDHEFYYNIETSTLFFCNKPIHLTKKEYIFLELLMENRNKIVDLYSIELKIWPESETNPNTIRSLVKRVRQKLKYRFIETVTSMGYRIVIPNSLQ